MTAAPGADRWLYATPFEAATVRPAEIGAALGLPVLGTSLSGRGALLAVLHRVLTTESAVWFPAYYCPEVVDTVRAVFPNRFRAYRDDPRAPAPELPLSEAGRADVVLVQNLFGLRQQPDYGAARCVVVEDHTHDPTSGWAKRTEADYAFAAVWKTYPIPDGGLVWSRRHDEEFALRPNRPALLEAVGARLSAMLLKQAYLSGSPEVGPDAYQRYEEPMKRAFLDLPHGAMTQISAGLLRGYPTDEWRAVRQRNHRFLADSFRQAGFDVLRPLAADAAPIGVAVDFHDPAVADLVNRSMPAARIHVAKLWPQAEIDGSPAVFSEEHLVFYTDHRYGERDLLKVVEAVRAVAEPCSRHGAA